MKIITKLAKVIPSRSLKLLNFLIKKNKFITAYGIREFDQRNPYNLKRDLELFEKHNLIIKKSFISEVGNKGKRKFERYKINLNNPLIKEIIKNVKTNRNNC